MPSCSPKTTIPGANLCVNRHQGHDSGRAGRCTREQVSNAMSAAITRRRILGSGIGAALIGAAAGVRHFALRDRPWPYEHVILLVADCLRADRLGCYGYKRTLEGSPRSITPNIDALADRGALFEANFAQSNWTETSMASLLYSINPVVHTDHHAFRYLPDLTTTLLYALDYAPRDGRNYRKTAVQGNPLMMQSVFASPFERIANLGGLPRTFKNDTTENTPRLIHERADVLNRRALELFDRTGEDNCFLYVHYMDVHESYSPVSRYRKLFPRLPAYDFGTLAENVRTKSDDPLLTDKLRHIQNDYDASLMFLDECIGDFLEELEKRGVADKSLLILTADHGQALGEHNTVGHEQNLYGEETHVPLILAGKNVPPARVRTRTRNIDIMATVADYVDLRPGHEGESLFPLAEAAAENRGTGHREVFSCVDYATRRPDIKREMTISPSGLAYIRTTDTAGSVVREEAYNVDDDPSMENDVFGSAPQDALRERLIQIRQQKRGQRNLRLGSRDIDDNPVLRDQMKALGYL